MKPKAEGGNLRRFDQAVDDSVVLAKRARHRRYEWCRLRNDFSDNPVFRVAARIAGLPLYQVQAFAGRLESLANRSTPRGYVGDFSAAEFAAAHDMTVDEAARIFAALEHPDVRWIDQERVATFYSRNPDQEDATAPERDKRRKARHWIRRELQRRVDAGALDADVLQETETILAQLADPELFELRAKLQSGVALEPALSTLSGHGVAPRGFVAATPRAQQTSSYFTAAVDNSGAEHRGSAAGLAVEQAAPDDAQSTEAELWLSSEAIRIVVERMYVVRQRAEQLVARWRRDLDDDPVAIARVIASVADAPVSLTAARFHVAITEHLRRCAQAKLKGEPLPLPPVRNFGTDPLRVANPQVDGHGVAGVAVDKPPQQQSNPAAPRSGTDG